MIIWGSKGRTTTITSGEFYCPDCVDYKPYNHQKVKRWFTLYFIPIFPLSDLGEYIECSGCKATYKNNVLDFDPKSNYLKFKAKLYQTDINNMNYETELVQTITLDKFIIDNNLEKIDLLKIDTEGNEFNVLKGLKKKINIVNNILIEIHHRKLFLNYNSEMIHQYLIDNGFKLVKKFKFPFCWVDSLYTKIYNFRAIY